MSNIYEFNKAMERLNQISRISECGKCFILRDAKTLVKESIDLKSERNILQNKVFELESDISRLKRELKISVFAEQKRGSTNRVRNALSSSIFDKCEKCGVWIRRDYDFCYNCGSVFAGEKVVEKEEDDW